MKVQLEQLAQKDENIAAAIDEVRKGGSKYTSNSVWASDKNPYQKGEEYMRSLGGDVVNIDLAGNLSEDAMQFLQQNSSAEFAVDFLFDRLKSYINVSPDILKKFLKNIPDAEIDTIYAKIEPEKARFWIHDDPQGNKRAKSDNLREEYMRKVLAEKIQTEDIILAHPDHLKNVLREERAE